MALIERAEAVAGKPVAASVVGCWWRCLSPRLISGCRVVCLCGPGCSVCPWVAARPRAVRAASFARRVASKPGQALPPPTGTAPRSASRSFRVCSCDWGCCTRSVGSAPLLIGLNVPDQVESSLTGVILSRGSPTIGSHMEPTLRSITCRRGFRPQALSRGWNHGLERPQQLTYQGPQLRQILIVWPRESIDCPASAT